MICIDVGIAVRSKTIIHLIKHAAQGQTGCVLISAAFQVVLLTDKEGNYHRASHNMPGKGIGS